MAVLATIQDPRPAPFCLLCRLLTPAQTTIREEAAPGHDERRALTGCPRRRAARHIARAKVSTIFSDGLTKADRLL